MTKVVHISTEKELSSAISCHLCNGASFAVSLQRSCESASTTMVVIGNICNESCAFVIDLFAFIPVASDRDIDKSLTITPITVEGRTIKATSCAVGELLAWLQHPNYLKVTHDVRALVLDCYELLGVVLSPTLDLGLLSLYTGYGEQSASRHHRDVLRLPSLCQLSSRYNLRLGEDVLGVHRVVLSLQALLLGDAPHPGVLADAVVATGRYVVLTLRRPKHLAFEHRYLPAGVVTIPDNLTWLPCSRCETMNPLTSLRSRDLLCLNCVELSLPCASFKKGYCPHHPCDYVHERIPCDKDSSCLEHVLGYCPFMHTDEACGVLLSVQATSACKQEASWGAERLSQYLFQKIQSSGMATLSSYKDRLDHPQQSGNPFPRPPSLDSEQNISAEATPSKNAPPTNSSANRRDATPTAIVASRPPCKHFFHASSGCKYGDLCCFSHQPVPLYIPVKVRFDPDKLHSMNELGREVRVVLYGDQSMQKTPTRTMCRIKSAASTAALQPCPRELSGRACHPRQSCPYLHLPAEITALSPSYQQTQHGDQQLREQDDASWGKEKSTVNHSHRRDHHSAGKSRVVQPEEALPTDSPVSKRRSHRVMRRNTKA